MADRLWIFGYGSLMWHPGFAFAEAQVARLQGFRRSFCMWSIHHRGTPQAPGLVLALDAVAGGACDGVAFGVDEDQQGVINYLRERELISSAYLESGVDLVLADGRPVRAVAFVVDAAHAQYCGGMALEAQARVIAGAVGGRGRNDEYLFNTVGHLAELGITDPDLIWLAARVREIRASLPSAP